ncbi:hypothetical protein TSTA_035950 [Talaromyces stipitatus ATCC 10500]|uniref:Uncharacterized protein n=1 Tax=Talaromyces stipitatus (strain ATCC 10500 / CBS 375.48 / QM 6759 / NRRL 1006) TaxID=441959 RepID=B8M7E9_TALSN|nr:uncharacterized protein TSTA_035950 [Talaromyces stipitatus ATCC 10500]EED20369.1 hypothetical protein TSTA_035950 [Talaromyces stipitatus ATCC 10500]
MGHASSKQVRNEPQTTRRLSKPPTNISTFNIVQPKTGKSSRIPGQDQNELLDESMFWKSPWTGDLLPKANPETNLSDHNRVRPFASLPNSQAELRGSLQGSKRWSSIDDFALMKHDHSLSRSGSFISRTLSRRASMVQRPTFQSQREDMTVGETRREPVIHFGPSDIGSHDLHLSVESLTSEDRSPVEDSRALLGRRKSFRRPGIATRNPSWGLYRTPLSSIQQEEERPFLSEVPASRPPWGQEEEDNYMPLYHYGGRATSPVALDYSHLSGLKKGTLRVVNASVSPASTDRLRLLTTSSLSKLPKHTMAQADSAVFISDSADEDEAVVIRDNTFYFEDSDVSGDGEYMETCETPGSEAIGYTRVQKPQSNTNADSGYSSVSSIRSGDSSGQSGASPSSSPVRSPTRYEVAKHVDKRGYFVNGISRPKEVTLENLIQSGSTKSSNSGKGKIAGHQEMPLSEHSRFYAQLSPLSIPSVPERTGICDRESDHENSEREMDNDEQTQITKDYSETNANKPSEPHMAFASKSLSKSQSRIERSRASYGRRPALPTRNLPVDRAQNYEAPRGRTRSCSVGRPRTKLVKSCKVAV